MGNMITNHWRVPPFQRNPNVDSRNLHPKNSIPSITAIYRRSAKFPSPSVKKSLNWPSTWLTFARKPALTLPARKAKSHVFTGSEDFDGSIEICLATNTYIQMFARHSCVCACACTRKYCVRACMDKTGLYSSLIFQHMCHVPLSPWPFSCWQARVDRVLVCFFRVHVLKGWEIQSPP